MAWNLIVMCNYELCKMFRLILFGNIVSLSGSTVGYNKMVSVRLYIRFYCKLSCFKCNFVKWQKCIHISNRLTKNVTQGYRNVLCNNSNTPGGWTYVEILRFPLPFLCSVIACNNPICVNFFTFGF